MKPKKMAKTKKGKIPAGLAKYQAMQRAKKAGKKVIK